MNLKVNKDIINPTTGAFHPYVTWDSNIEPDFIDNGGSYNIYRGVNTNCESEPVYSLLTSLTSLANQYIDNTLILYPRASGLKGCASQYETYSYKIEAVDNTLLPSLKSERGLISGYRNQCDPDSPDNPLFTNTDIPESFSLNQNYPNPFNPSTEIKYAIPQNTFVTVKVYNVLGELVQTLADNVYQNAGYYTVRFDGTSAVDGLASGIYFYTLNAGTFVETKKMVLIK